MTIKPATDLLGELYQLIDRLSATRGLANVLDEVLSAAMSLTDSEMGTIRPYQSSTQSHGEQLYKGFPADYVEHMTTQQGPVQDGPRERASRSGKRVSVADVYDDPAFTPFLPWVRRAGFASMQATPIFSRYGESVGTICTFQREHHVPSDEQLDLLDLYGKLAGDAIERENGELTLKESEESFRRLYDLMLRLSAMESLEPALSEVLSAALDLVEADAGHIRLLDIESGEYRFVAQTGFKEDLLLRFGERAREFFLRSPAVEAIQKAQRVVVEDLEAYPPLRQHLEIVRAVGFRSLQVTPLFNSEGNPIGSISTFFARRHIPPASQLRVLDLYAQLAADAIERVRTADALRISEERLRLATMGAMAYPWELDLRSNHLWYAGDLEQFGAPAPGSDLRRMLAMVHPEDRALVTRTLRDAERRSGQFELEVRAYGRGGGTRWFRISGELIKDESGRNERFVGIGKDITAHKSTESKLRKSEERFRQVYGLMVRLSATSGHQAALDEVLGAALEVLGTDMGTVRLHRGNDAEMATVAASRGFPQDYLDYFAALPPALIAEAPVIESLRTRRPVFVEDMCSHPAFRAHVEVVQSAGAVSLLVWPLIARSGEALGSISAVFRERALPASEQLQVLELYASLAADAIEREERKEQQALTEQSLRKAIMVKDEFLGMVSHELRTPMTVIRGLSSILERKPNLPPETLKETYADLRTESDRLYHLIENMLALARVEAGQRRPTELVLIDKVIEASAATLRSELPDIDLEVVPLPRDVIFQVVPQYLVQILHNLVENARKYSPKGSTIQLGATVEDSWVQIFVADRGIGVHDPAVIFQPFNRENQAEKIASGMGLGLAVCRTLVEAQSGRIWAEPREGGGAMFCFTLPR